MNSISIVIVGRNEYMTDCYRGICDEYHCKSKIFSKTEELQSIGPSDLFVLFISTVSHKMVRSTLNEIMGKI